MAFGDLVRRQRRRVGLELSDMARDARPTWRASPRPPGGRPRARRRGRAISAALALPRRRCGRHERGSGFPRRATASGDVVARRVRRISLPAASRATRKRGCTSKMWFKTLLANSPITESTRNGMSSLTSSMTETSLSRGPSAGGAVVDTDFRCPGLRSAKEAPARRRRRRQARPPRNGRDPRRRRRRTGAPRNPAARRRRVRAGSRPPAPAAPRAAPSSAVAAARPDAGLRRHRIPAARRR